MSSQRYYTLDNGGDKYLVKINSGNRVQVFGDTQPIAEYDAERVFVGTSRLHGRTFDGNSILVQLGTRAFKRLRRDGGAMGAVAEPPNTYVLIGHDIYEFKARDKIVEYESPVGNSDVPYPYAVDEAGRV